MPAIAPEEERLRRIELDHAGLVVKVESLFDHQGSPGLLSQMRNVLADKIDGYFLTVSKFIEGEPARKEHIERNSLQSVLDAKRLAEEALVRSDEKQQRLHNENKRTAEQNEREVRDLKKEFERHEKFVQRGIGIMLFGQFVLLIAGFFTTAIGALGGLVWWFFTHVAVKP